MVDCIEIKIGNSKRLILKDNILQEKGLEPIEKRKEGFRGLISDSILIGLIFIVFGKQLGILVALNSVINRVVKLII